MSAGAEAQAAGTATLPLTAEGLTFRAAARRLIDIPELTVTAGGPLVVMGPNGAGKSLLLRLLHGLIAPTAGAVRPSGAAARRGQAMVFQRPVVLRRSVAANVDFALRTRGVGGAERGRRRHAWLETARLADKARQPATTLSAGEAQRLALARALATEPHLLFLDEPTANLDPGAAADIERLAAGAAARGTKLVLVTHDTGQAQRLAAEVAFLYRGRVAEYTPAASFFARPRSEMARRFLDGALVL